MIFILAVCGDFVLFGMKKKSEKHGDVERQIRRRNWHWKIMLWAFCAATAHNCREREMAFNGGILIDDDDREEVQEQLCPYTVHSIR